MTVTDHVVLKNSVNGVDSLVSFTSRSYMCHFSSWYWFVGFVCLSVSLLFRSQINLSVRLIPLRLVLYSYYIKYHTPILFPIPLTVLRFFTHVGFCSSCWWLKHDRCRRALLDAFYMLLTASLLAVLCSPTYQQACQPQGKTDQKRRQTRYKWG